MAQGFRVFLQTVDAEVEVDGMPAKVERMHGCNGSEHVDFLARIYYHDGEICGGDDLGYENRRPCDRSCEGKPDDGWFLGPTGEEDWGDDEPDPLNEVSDRAVHNAFKNLT